MPHVIDSATTTTRGTHKVAPVIPVVPFGLSLSAFFSISFVLCVLGYYILPDLPVAHGALAIILPGFQFDSAPRFVVGLLDSIAWGWYIALIFGPLFNYFVARRR